MARTDRKIPADSRLIREEPGVLSKRKDSMFTLVKWFILTKIQRGLEDP